MSVALLCAAVLAEPWTLKPDFSANAKAQWSLAIDATVGGEQRASTGDLIESVKGPATPSGDQPVHLELANLVVDGMTFPGNTTDAIVNSQNVIQSATEDDNSRQMYTPLLFDYPTAPVGVGDTWKSTVTPKAQGAAKVNYEWTVKAINQQNGADVMDVTAKVKEDGGDSPLSGDEEWWLDKTGKVLKFKLTLKNWHVTMAGGLTVDATINGKPSAG